MENLLERALKIAKKQDAIIQELSTRLLWVCSLVDENNIDNERELKQFKKVRLDANEGYKLAGCVKVTKNELDPT